MHRLTFLGSLALAVVVAGACGGKKKDADDPSKANDKSSETDGGGGGGDTSAGGGDTDGGADAPKKDECVGFDIGNIEDVLLKSSCEETAKPDAMQNVDLKGKLEVVASAVPTKIGAGGKADLLVTFMNKSKEPLTLHFRIDPTPRFETETYDKKGKRVDMPAGNPPPPPKGVTQPPPSESKAAKVTIAPNGSAKMRLSWEAVKMKWAPEKVKGTPPERGYPRVPNGGLPKGKYTVKVVTPLVGVFEGVDHEMTAPKIEIEVGS
jgi:hypothetical protein